MKKLFLGIIATITFSNLSFGQATFEHSYSSNNNNSTRINSFITASGINYYTLNSTLNTISIYNSSHTLVKTVNITVPANSGIDDIFAMSDKLFNSDNLIEFIIVTQQNIAPFNFISSTLYNENGVILQQFGPNRGYAQIVKDTNNNFKLITCLLNPSTSNQYIYDIYSLTGTLSSSQVTLLAKQFISFPNPTESTLTITNILNKDENANLEVFDINGKKVLESYITGENDHINIDTTQLASGVYIYKLKGETNRFIKQ